MDGDALHRAAESDHHHAQRPLIARRKRPGTTAPTGGPHATPAGRRNQRAERDQPPRPDAHQPGRTRPEREDEPTNGAEQQTSRGEESRGKRPAEQAAQLPRRKGADTENQTRASANARDKNRANRARKIEKKEAQKISIGTPNNLHKHTKKADTTPKPQGPPRAKARGNTRQENTR